MFCPIFNLFITFWYFTLQHTFYTNIWWYILLFFNALPHLHFSLLQYTWLCLYIPLIHTIIYSIVFILLTIFFEYFSWMINMSYFHSVFPSQQPSLILPILETIYIMCSHELFSSYVWDNHSYLTINQKIHFIWGGNKTLIITSTFHSNFLCEQKVNLIQMR